MYLQVLLFAVVGQLSSASSDGLPSTVTEDSGMCSGTPLSSCSTHHSPFFRVSDGLPPNLDFTVFAVRQHGATSADPPLQKRAGCIDTSGHGTAAADRCSPIMYLQVSYYNCFSYRNDDICLLAVSWPSGFLKFARSAALFLSRLLLLHGDVEENPGPMNKPQEEKIEFRVRCY
ncbi:hypothetical protein MRX96_040565 [Rhipicephalus microplus]